MKTFWKIVNWKLLLALVLAVAMLFGPKWLGRDIMTFERVMQLPVIDLNGEAEEEEKPAVNNSHTLVLPLPPKCECAPKCPCDLNDVMKPASQLRST